MKTNVKNIAMAFLAAVTIASCNNDDETKTKPATAAEFAALKEVALEAQTQKFTATAGVGNIVLTSKKGVTITINGNCLTKDGAAVSGAIEVEFIELFDKGTMLVTNKPTMGIMPDGKQSLLLSGGEFFINATQGGKNLIANCTINLVVPTDLTGEQDTAMTLWKGIIDEEGDLAWKEVNREDGTNNDKGGVDAGQGNYYVSFGNFGWTNVDKFYSDPRPRTTILADAPTGFDNTNSAIYLSYDGEGTNALAKLDTYTAAGLFSEHYGQIPIGLACHVIFATEENGQWRYAIKGVTVQANDVYTFTMGETTLGTEAQLIAAINAIQ